jgi:hypothetical protein
VTGYGGIKLYHLNRRSAVVVPHFIAANAVKFTDSSRKKCVNDGTARHPGTPRSGDDNIAAVAAEREWIHEWMI